MPETMLLRYSAVAWRRFLSALLLSALCLSTVWASAVLATDIEDETDIRRPWEMPAIPLSACVAVPVLPGGPEDLVAIPGEKSVAVAVARRGNCVQRPEGALIRLDLSACDSQTLNEECVGAPEVIYTEGGGKKDFKPVGLAVLGDLSPSTLPRSCIDDAASVILAVDDSRGGRVRCLRLDPNGELVGPPAVVYPQPLGSQVNGIGVSTFGDVLVTNARGKPSMMFRARSSTEWLAPESSVKLAFANGVAFFEPDPDAPKRHPTHVLVADFTKRRIHLFRAQNLRNASARPVCTFPTPALPDNLHLRRDEQGRPRLLVGTFQGLFPSLMHAVFKTRSVVGAVWDVDLERLAKRIRAGERLPKDCGIGIAHWRLMVRDDHSKHLSGASAAVKVDDLLVVGQLHRPTVLVCPWREPDG